MQIFFNSEKKKQQKDAALRKNPPFLHDFVANILQEDISDFAEWRINTEDLLHWPFAPNSEILKVTPPEKGLVSFLHLHWMNDVPGVLAQYYQALKSGGIFAGCMLGAHSMQRSKQQLLSLETEITGGAHQRFAPLIHIKDLGALLQRAGFSSPIVTHIPFALHCQNLSHALRMLHACGEQSALLTQAPLSRVLYQAMMQKSTPYEDQLDLLFWYTKRT